LDITKEAVAGDPPSPPPIHFLVEVLHFANSPLLGCSASPKPVPENAEAEDVECWFEGYGLVEGGVQSVEGQWQVWL